MRSAVKVAVVCNLEEEVERNAKWRMDECQKDEWMDEWKNKSMNQTINKYMDEWTNGWTKVRNAVEVEEGERNAREKERWINETMMNGCKNKRMDE